MSADRNLLFAILAVQMDFITRDQLIAGLNAWVLAKTKSIGSIFEEQGAMSPNNRGLLEPLVDAHVQAHGGDPAKSLAALSSIESVRQDLQALPDPDIQGTIAFLNRDSSSGQPVDQVQRPGITNSDGRFRVLRSHARGGLGEVFLARDEELSREVALKEIQPQFVGSTDSRARFVFEAEVTGGLEHPGIVPVYSLGAHKDGRPFYAMRFIRGDSLKEAIQKFHRTGPLQQPGFDTVEFRQLLGRFIDVCEAIAYAHSRGVLHRDLKPGNIMLGKYGETLVVDWGLAKAVGKPESAAGHSDEPMLMPASGSGSAPTQQGAAMGTPAYMSPEQAKGEIELLGPASDVYSLGATLFDVLTGKPPLRGSPADVLVRVTAGDVPTPRSVNPKLPAALDAICRKAMALRPADRYASAKHLSQDLEHWLADEPVSAFTEPMPARAGRWVRRHRALTTGLAASLVIATIGSVIGAVVFGQQNRQLVRTNADLGLARIDADEKRQAAEAATGRARANFRMALDAFNDMVHGIQTRLGTRGDTQDVRKELLEKAQDGLQKLLKSAEQAGGDSTLNWAYFRMGDVHLLLGDTAKALEEYRIGNNRAKAQTEADPQNADAQRDLSVSLNLLGNVSLQRGNASGALEYYRQSLGVRERLAEADPNNAQSQRNLFVSFDLLGDVSLQMGNTPGALEYYLQSLKVNERRAHSDPDSIENQRDLFVSIDKLGTVKRRMGDIPEALKYYLKSLEVCERLVKADAKNVHAQRDLSITFERLVNVTLQMGKVPEALKYARQGLEIREQLAKADPKSAMAQRDLSHALDRVGNVALQMGNATGALDYYHQSLKIREPLAKSDPKSANAQRDLSLSFNKVGDVMRQLGDAAGALEYYRKGMEVCERLAKADPKNTQAQRDLSVSFQKLGDATVRMGNALGALESYRQGLEVCDRLAKADPKNFEAQTDLFIGQYKLGTGHQAALQFELAKTWFENANASLRYFQKEGWIKKPEQIFGRWSFQKWSDDIRARLVKCDKAEQAISDLDFALKQPADEISGLLDIRLRAATQRADLPACIATAEAMEKLAGKDEDDLYNVACMWSLCCSVAKARGADAAPVANGYSDKAMEWLKQAVAAGYKNFARMGQDKDLDAIRDREDFKALIKELEAKAAAPRPAAEKAGEKK